MQPNSLPPQLIKEQIKNVKYAVRGPIVTLANELERAIQEGNEKKIKKILYMNIGDMQACNLVAPITYPRKLLSYLLNPELWQSKYSDDENDDEIVVKANEFLHCCKNGAIGSYTQSEGNLAARQAIATYINKRDSIDSESVKKCLPDDILLGNGASDVIESVLALLDTSKDGGIMMPVPQYPLYSALISYFGIQRTEYYLDESQNWSITRAELERSFSSNPNANPKAIIVINPGNPTGSVLSLSQIETIIEFAAEKRLSILADEVYQFNTYKDHKFNSFRQVALQMINNGHPLKEKIESVMIASFMSTSKGFLGDCGFRGGYCQLENIDPATKELLLTLRRSRLCSNVFGQAVLFSIFSPPTSEKYRLELESQKKFNLDALAENARLVSEGLKKCPLITCSEIQGAMYAFPKVDLPEKFIDECSKAEKEPNFEYCYRLLQETGICTVPGSGFFQVEGTFHFRVTILLEKEDNMSFLNLLSEFNSDLIKKYQ